jgi:hypothetical protein
MAKLTEEHGVGSSPPALPRGWSHPRPMPHDYQTAAAIWLPACHTPRQEKAPPDLRRGAGSLLGPLIMKDASTVSSRHCLLVAHLPHD